MKRLILAASAAALLVLGATVPVFAQDPPDTPEEPPPPDPVELPENPYWTGHVTAPDTATTSTFDVAGSFEYEAPPVGDPNHERTLIAWVMATAPAEAEEVCQTSHEQRVEVARVKPTGDPGADPTTLSFTVPVTSPCNVGIELIVDVVACHQVQVENGRCWDNNERQTVMKPITVDAPPIPVDDVIASAEDTDTKDVNVSWTLPEGAAHDTTYSVERAGPDPGEEPEWTTIAPAEPEEPVEPAEGEVAEEPAPLESPITDTVEDEGVYLYRVVAERPSATPEGEPHVVAGTEDDVRVGEPPATTTTGPPVTQPPTTVSIPRLNTGGTRDRVSTRSDLTPVQPSAPTTIDTGFEETLDYGDEEPGELAAEGQSVINSDDDGVVGPGAAAAAALVLVGWAGHIFYFRRLAAQF